MFGQAAADAQPMTRRSRALAERRPAVRSASSGPDRPAVVVEPGTHSLTITYRLRETGMYDGAPFVEAWKPLPPPTPPRRRRVEQHTVEVGPMSAVACGSRSDRRTTAAPPDRTPTTTMTSTSPTPASRRRPAAHGVRVAARRRAAVVLASRAARLEPDRERALRRRHPLRHPQGRQRVRSNRVGVVLRRRTTTAVVLRQAVARWARRQPVVAGRLPPGVGSRRRATEEVAER